MEHFRHIKTYAIAWILSASMIVPAAATSYMEDTMTSMKEVFTILRHLSGGNFRERLMLDVGEGEEHMLLYQSAVLADGTVGSCQAAVTMGKKAEVLFQDLYRDTSYGAYLNVQELTEGLKTLGYETGINTEGWMYLPEWGNLGLDEKSAGLLVRYMRNCLESECSAIPVTAVDYGYSFIIDPIFVQTVKECAGTAFEKNVDGACVLLSSVAEGSYCDEVYGNLIQPFIQGLYHADRDAYEAVNGQLIPTWQEYYQKAVEAPQELYREALGSDLMSAASEWFAMQEVQLECRVTETTAATQIEVKGTWGETPISCTLSFTPTGEMPEHIEEPLMYTDWSDYVRLYFDRMYWMYLAKE